MTANIEELARENLLLSFLPAEIYSRLLPAMKVVEFGLGEIICKSEDPIANVFFPLKHTLISLVALSAEGASVEVGMVGKEGLIEITAFMGAPDSPYTIVVQGPGRFIKIDIKIFLDEFKKEEAVRDIILSYIREMYISISQTALCNRVHSLEARLARWLMMSHDKVNLKELPLTHEFLAKMLGTDRGSVSVAAKTLQDLKFISYSRGKISIEDATALKGACCECYEFLNRQLQKSK